ncbi:MAG: hypothetical protein FWC85_00210, partial [Elusimicrobia bacterium]|nr:hypothetical protein [Elusimicrobiota bacterium]
EYTGIFRNEQQQRRASTALGVAGVILSARGDHASADEAQASRDELTRDSFRCELIVIFQ